jgi:hypothetical protein
MDDEDGFSTTPTPRDNPILSFALEHVTLMVSVFAASIFAIRCVAVTGGDTYTAFVLLAHSSLGDAIRALLFSFVPVLLTIAAFVPIAIVARRRQWFDLRAVGLVAASLLTYTVGLYLSGQHPLDWRNWAPFVFFSTIVFIVGRPEEGAPSVWVHAGPYVGVSAIIVALAIIGGEFWLPRERLVFKSEAPFTGYVLNTSGDHLVIMHDDLRIIIEKPKATLQDRDLCYPEDHKARSSKVAADSPVCP